MTETEPDMQAIRDAIGATGYTVTDIGCESIG